MTSAQPTVRPFPLGSLEALTRAEAASETRLRRIARSLVHLEGIEAVLAELTADPVRVHLRRIRPLERSRGADDAVGVLLAPSSDRGVHRRVLVEVEGALGVTLVAKALRQRAPRITDPSRVASPALAGSFAAVTTSVLRRAHAGIVLAVISAGPGAALAADFATATRGATTAWLTVTVGRDAFEARVSISDALAAPAAPPLTASALRLLGDAPIALALVVATTLASAADLAALAPGDALVPTGMTVAAHGAELRGPVTLVAPQGERGLSAELAEGGRLVVRGHLETHSWEPTAMSSRMPEGSDASAEISSAPPTVAVIEDAPVVVRVELGVVEMKAREWAALAPGDVVTLGRKLGEPAILRASGVEIARGELVVVDGEMAVRVTSRTPQAAGDAG
ncbi:MAG: Type secretion inner rane protein [Labilithrix sp.]|nr:Type secretion inner rane protein [Labilithrix sp.]